MKARWMSLGVAIGLALALTLGFTFSSGNSSGTGPSGMTPTAAQTDWSTAMDAMHDAPGMLQMHARMPAALQARCDAMHEQMEQMMGGDMSSHHPGASGDGMMDSGSGSSSGMMDSGSGMMGS